MKSLVISTLVALLCLVISNPLPVLGETTTTTVKKIPFHGKLQAVDKWAKSITIEGKTPRVFYLTSTTKITNGAGEPSTFSDATVGEDVGGSYTEDSAGKKTLFSVRFGAKTGDATKSSETKSSEAESAPAPTPEPTAAPTPEPAAAPAAAAVDTKKKYKFTGTVVSADGGSIVVHGKTDETYAITDATKITDASGKAAKISSFKAGAKVSGSYTKAEDGTTFTATSLKLSK